MSPQASGMFGSIADYMDNSGAHRAGNQTQELFGEAAANRVIITPEGLRNLFESHQSIEEMKDVFIHQLSEKNGIIEEIRAANNETFTDAVVMNHVVRQISENIVVRLPHRFVPILSSGLCMRYSTYWHPDCVLILTVCSRYLTLPRNHQQWLN